MSVHKLYFNVKIYYSTLCRMKNLWKCFIFNKGKIIIYQKVKYIYI